MFLDGSMLDVMDIHFAAEVRLGVRSRASPPFHITRPINNNIGTITRPYPSVSIIAA